MKIRTKFVSNSSSSSFIVNSSSSVDFVEVELKKLLDFYNDYLNNNLLFESVFEVFYGDREDKRHHWNYSKEWINKVIIHSINDNSIPYEIMEFIAEKFDVN